MPMTRSEIGAAFLEMEPNLNEIIMDEYEKEPSIGRQIFNVDKIDTPFINDEAFSGIQNFEEKDEGEEGAIARISHLYPKQYVPITYSLLLRYSYETMADDKLKIITKASASMGESARITDDILAANILNTAFSTTGPDSTYLCSISHPLVSGGTTWRNRPTNGMAFNRTSLALAIVDWMDEQKNETGQKVNFDLAYLVHPATPFLDVHETLESINRPDTANNAINVIKSNFQIKPVTWMRINDPDFWFLMAPVGKHSVKIIDRAKFSQEHGANGEAGYLWTRGEFRADYGWSKPQGVYGSPGIGG